MRTLTLARDSLQAHEPSAGWSSWLVRQGYQHLLVLRSQINLYYFWEKRWFFVAMAMGALMLSFDPPRGLSQDGWIMLTMSASATLLFMTQPVPLPTVALMIIVGQVLLVGVDSDIVAKNLMTDSVLFIMGSLMLAVAVVKQKLDKRIAWAIVRMTGTRTVNVCFGISAVCGLLASFIGEHTVAAMMLPVGLTLISLTSQNPQRIRRLSAFILFSIVFGCTTAGIGTPSGGARNAIMIGYWQQFFYNPADPATYRYLVDYMTWMLYGYPLFLAQLVFVTPILYFTFRPERTDLARAIAKLRLQIELDGPMTPAAWLSILLFVMIMIGWIFTSQLVGMGTVALLGTCAFLVTGLVKWEDINSGVNWGVVLLYAAAISLGVEMQATGAAAWLAASVLGMFEPVGMGSGMGLLVGVAFLTAGVANTMAPGAAVAVLGPIVLKLGSTAGADPLHVGFITAFASAFAYLAVASSPASTIVFSSGYLRISDFLKVGWRMALVSMILLLLQAYFLWPYLDRLR
ncbi:sodium-dependent dicarboxylate transporter 2/3/5 [Rhodoligotrophos appendicifer]|uniref:SLC13 family permease n=1 Tax=Rhodoligotrophos appendicifer TaxID=987056 RepID=UPI001960999F|nr:DASS family sodium-coupled anion symporter [Rhodoligotrophos appendicifer]